MHLISNHPVLSALTAFYLLSSLVDALKLVAPKPTDKRLYLFLYGFANAIAGNALTALQHFLTPRTDYLNVQEIPESAPVLSNSRSGSNTSDPDPR